MRLLLTGVAGFIASKVAELLLAEGHQVVGVDNLNDAYDPRLKEHRLQGLLGRPGFEFARLDIFDRRALEDFCAAHAAHAARAAHAAHTGRPADAGRAVRAGGAPFDAIINLAARAGVRPSVSNPWVYVDTNMTGTLNLLEVCRQQGIEKFILASTSSLYGGSNPLPFSEELDTSRPLSPYAASKKGAEAMTHTYHHLHGIDVTVLRYFTVYGPAGRPDMSIFRFCRWIAEGDPVEVLGDGRQSRDFTYVDDIARGTILGLKRMGYEVINLGSDQPHELMRTIELIEQETGKKANLTFGPADKADVRATWANVDKARSLLGWESQVGLEEGIRRSVAWYMDNRELASGLTL